MKLPKFRPWVYKTGKVLILLCIISLAGYWAYDYFLLKERVNALEELPYQVREREIQVIVTPTPEPTVTKVPVKRVGSQSAESK